jgi:thiamine-monophosphate kinase
MADSEFALIRRHFTRPAPDGVLGVGDDCALLPPMAGHFAISTDLLVEGIHFFPDVDPMALGHKALAVNLSDLAAMGAAPRACTLAIALPHVDHDWLDAFARGFFALADAHGCALVGGDTTRSPQGVTIDVTVFGEVPASQALRRDGASVGDDIWVSGWLGDADVALRLLLADGSIDDPDGMLLAATRRALEWPQPRVALGLALRGIASAALDVSDGLAQDLGHILAASKVGAELDIARLPLSPALSALPAGVARRSALSGGDVYELCFCAPPAARAALAALSATLSLPLTRVGRIDAGSGLRVLDETGTELAPVAGGFDHFGSGATA